MNLTTLAPVYEWSCQPPTPRNFSFGTFQDSTTRGRSSQCALSLHNLPQPTPVNIPERNRPMIALQHDGTRRRLGAVHGGARGAVHCYIALHRKPVEHHADEFRVLRFLSRRIEARRAEPDVVRLPLARLPAGVPAWRRSAHAVVVDPTMIEAAAIGRGYGFSRAVAVENLHL